MCRYGAVASRRCQSASTSRPASYEVPRTIDRKQETMCPETTLLAASVDGTLFPGDARAIDQHVAACARCAALLGRLRQERDSEVAQRIGSQSQLRSRRTALAGV